MTVGYAASAGYGAMVATQVSRQMQSGSTSTTGTSTKTTSRYQTGKTQETVVHSLTDNGTGGLGDFGSVNYAGKTLTVRLVELDAKTEGYKADHESAAAFETTSMGGGGSDPGSTGSTQKGGEYGDNAVSEQILAASTLRVTYATDFVSDIPNTMTYRPPVVTIDLCPYTSDYIVPGSVRFTWMGQVYEDYDGVLVRGRTAGNAGIVAGQINYSSGIANVTDYVVSGPATTFTLDSLWTVRQKWTTASIFMRTQAAPLKPAGVVLNLADAEGNSITAMGDIDGTISGTHLRGKIDYEFGLLELQFGDYLDDATLTPEQKAEWWYSAADVGAVQAGKIWRPWPVDPTTLRYNSVSYFYLPLDADIIGLDPVRLPPDGRVPIYRVGSYVVIGHTGVVPAATYAANQTINCARTRLSRVYLVGADGQLIQGGYTVNLDAGTVTVTDVAGWVQPVTIKHRIEQMARVADVQVNGTMKLTKQLAHEFPVGSVVSSAIMAGNLRARALPVFDQQSWDGVTWSDITVGNPAPSSYNDGAFPVVVTNAGAITERFALRVLAGGVDVEVIGEHVGNLGTFSRNTEIAPINPVSGAPYFRLPAAGWGSGWAAGNVLFLSTVGAFYPLALIRAVQPGQATGTDYAFEITERGDVDRAPTNPVI